MIGQVSLLVNAAIAIVISRAGASICTEYEKKYEITKEKKPSDTKS